MGYYPVYVSERNSLTRTIGWGAHERPLNPAQHMISKAHTQKIESKPINLHTRIKRLVRRTVSSSIAISLDDPSDMKFTTLEHLQAR